MNTVRKILVPIDFSEDSANRLKYAVSLAKTAQAEVVVLHVTQKKEADSVLDLLAFMQGVPMVNPPAAMPIDRLLREKALDLYNFVEKTVRHPGSVKIGRRVALGNKADNILAAIKEESIDLMVLAIRKTSFFSYLIARGKLLKMISRIPCPVLLKPSFEETWPARGVIGPSVFAR